MISVSTAQSSSTTISRVSVTLVPAGSAFNGELEGDDASFYISASPGKSGIAFLGDRDDFVGTGRMRIASIADSPTQLNTTVVFAREESELTLHGYTRI